MDQAQFFSISNIKHTKMNPNTKITTSNNDVTYVAEKAEDISDALSTNRLIRLTKIITRNVYGSHKFQKITKIFINPRHIIEIESLTENS